MENMNYDLRSVQEVRNLARKGQIATERLAGSGKLRLTSMCLSIVRRVGDGSVSMGRNTR